MSFFTNLVSFLIAHSISYKRENKYIFTNKNICLKEGSILFLLGPNGSGKTTFLKVLAGLLRKNGGSLIHSSNKINFMHFLDGFDPFATVFENLKYWVQLFDGDLRQLLPSIERMQLRRFLHSRVGTLSTGQRKKVALARVLSISAPIWFLDEPFVALDAETFSLFEQIIQNHRTDGGIVVTATHIFFSAESASVLTFIKRDVL